MSAPDVIGHYRIEQELGRGAMGVVYLARDTKLGRQVAIKALPAELARDPSRRTKFEREARVLAAINHPNIGAIYGLEELGDDRFLVLELAEGVTLADQLATAPPAPDGSGYRILGVGESLRICAQIAAGVAAAHEQGIIHRDLKPANVKIRPDGVVKVLDFGIARGGPTEPVAPPPATSGDAATVIADAAPQSASTHLGSIIGTPGYMSPEQARGKAVGRATDVWSLACMLFECLTGRLAFPGETIADALASTLTMEPDWSALPGETPSRVLSLMRRCLEKDPKRRLEYLGEVRQELERAVAEMGVGGTTGGEVTAVGERGGPAGGGGEGRGELGNVPPLAAFGKLLPREQESAALASTLTATKAVTVTGVGGSGKTMLCMLAAQRLRGQHRDGVWWVRMESAPNRAYAEYAAAIALGARPRAGASLREALAERIGARSMLLVLDACQHAPTSCAELVLSLMESCPNLRVIVVTREPLGLRRESIFRVTPMPFELAGADPDGPDAVRLFETRLRGLIPDYTTSDAERASISELCRRLQGMPLSIELAAGVVTAPPISDLLDKLDHRTRLIGLARPESQPADQVVKLMIDWSYGLLSEMERGMLRRLSVFAGGATLRSAAAVSGAGDSFPDPASDDVAGGPISGQEERCADIIARLISKGVLTRISPGDAAAPIEPAGDRFIVPETVRVFARDRLMEFTGAMGVVKRHVQYYGELARQASPRIEGNKRAVWISKLGSEYANLLAAADSAPLTGEGATGEIIQGVVRQFERAVGLLG